MKKTEDEEINTDFIKKLPIWKETNPDGWTTLNNNFMQYAPAIAMVLFFGGLFLWQYIK